MKYPQNSIYYKRRNDGGTSTGFAQLTFVFIAKNTIYLYKC